MEFVSVRELTSASKETWERLKQDGEITITNNGKPTAILVNVSDTSFEETLNSIRQAKSMRLLNSIWQEAVERGPLTDKEIEAEIQAARTEIREAENPHD
ncbi:type II toxin-antitoxin system Phd/YefM family antitoxin [Leadbettera azotonutricia]|uniref:Prevent-host-death family protein n=1 Tax=Leadbettera azotonutricia (strain ATCC BAA-888 / DSM 13862 / ZAS-9) TaxID=545695 RepID=F5YD21_LEAAZ|nr:type II toxin-antitoxin system Phd/YefM family antitoxin [Leadbettera azotonutricia]AEF81196.1 prevent-host-death family protein [Leadbettera azotonutricia ZAS-9]